MHVALSRSGAVITAVELDDAGEELSRFELHDTELPGWVRGREAEHPRWVWSDTARWYPAILAAGVRVERCLDLRLCPPDPEARRDGRRFGSRDGGAGQLG